MAKYIVHAGTFPCHTCGTEVKTIRQYTTQKRLTWMCPERHVTEISLETKKKKEDYERTE